MGEGGGRGGCGVELWHGWGGFAEVAKEGAAMVEGEIRGTESKQDAA